ncbi:GDSL-type esterase/lipase family protein [Flavobacterium cellulosilyticum]|uniref:GDSL family lipase n=1 Tax=Flavobacterium cellulosilyticum TaxID=2541731 RepID=A0A4R5CI44_9FLAO|nr:GDSL-type esterase/lipase family protein [Flavobacterium cellulosilyticum]TDD97004.1 GDSL family lipase [Flavobacterium cellulosilyticum]
MFWFHKDIERLEKEIAALEYNPKLIFYGSSTFTLWNELSTIFKEHNPLNLGFGGSTLAACTWFFERVFENIKDIEAIVIYAGENDLGEGRHPEEVLMYLENILYKIRAKYGNIPCTCISIKPSKNRLHLSGSIRYTNRNIQELMSKDLNFHYVNIYDIMLDQNGNPKEEYYIGDGLHLNQVGYKLWEKYLKKHPEIFPKKTLEKR